MFQIERTLDHGKETINKKNGLIYRTLTEIFQPNIINNNYELYENISMIPEDIPLVT